MFFLFPVQFEYVKRLIPKDHATVFFEVGTAEEEFGRMYVKLVFDSALVQQMKLMCSGESGVSYKGTCFYNIDEKEGLLKGGDYEKNDGTGGKPIFTAAELDDGFAECAYEKLTGVLVTDTHSTRFHFHLHNKKEYVRGIIGKVKVGIKLLKTLAKIQPITSSMIRDCGVFLPMLLPELLDESDE